MCPFIVQPGMPAEAAMAPVVATGLIASPRAHKSAMKSLITGLRYDEVVTKLNIYRRSSPANAVL